MRSLAIWTLLAFALVFIAQTEAQAPSPATATREQLIVQTLEALIRDEWPLSDYEPQWVQFRGVLNDELRLRPDGPLAALVRRAAARIDVAAANVVVQNGEELSISVDAQPRFELDTPIPYVVDIHASVDGGNWFRLGTFPSGGGCGRRNNEWVSHLERGVHRVHAIADISFLSESHGPRDRGKCRFLKPGEVEDMPEPPAEHVIQRERRVLPAVSFGIFPDLFGVPAVLAHTLEPGLPEVPLSQWLNDVFAAVPDMKPIARTDWLVDFCKPEEASVFMGIAFGGWRKAQQVARRQTRDLCVSLLTGFPDDRVLALRLRVGTVNEDGALWTIEPLAFHDLSIGGSGNVIDIPHLSLLPQMVTLPGTAFPELDLAIWPGDIRYVPANAKPGDPITITATLRNVGERDAPFTSGFIGVHGTPYPAVVRDFLVDIPPQGTLDVSMRTTMPPSGSIVVQFAGFPDIWLFRQGPYNQIRDVNPENSAAFKPFPTSRP